MRLLIVGTGSMASHHATHFEAIEGVEIVGAVDVDPARLGAFCEGHDIPNRFETLDAALDWDGFDAVTNVGNRPTFGADSFAVESHLLNFHTLELNEQTPLTLTFLKRLRAEMRFPGPEALREQIGRDVATARRYFTLCRAAASRPRSSGPRPALPVS